MNWLPFGRETLVSPLSKEELLDRLAAVTRGTRAEGLPEPRPLFYGQVEENGFRISRVIEKGDNFLPYSSGRWRIRREAASFFSVTNFSRLLVFSFGFGQGSCWGFPFFSFWDLSNSFKGEYAFP